MSTQHTVTDDELVAAVRQAADEGKRDLCEGGVVPEHIADDLPIAQATIRSKLHRLNSEDKLATVRGANPETLKPRQSYLPPDHPDVGTPD